MPPVSVVVPLFNEVASVQRLLGALDEQQLLPSEAVLVDAGSEDGTAERIGGSSHRFPVKLLRRGRLNPGLARNEGSRAASHGWIAFIDGGTVPDPCWLVSLMEGASEDAQVVFGSYQPVCDSYFRRCAALAYVPATSAAKGIRGPFVASMALRREAFEAIGGFPPYRASEDLVFMERLVAGGYRVAYAPRAVVHWQTAPTATATFRRFALYSQVNLAAGRGQYWHGGLARQYAVVATILVCGGYVIGPAILLTVPAWFGARALRAAWAKWGDLPFPTLRPDYVVGAAAVLTIVDLATWAGAIRWLAGEIGLAERKA